MWNQTFTGQNVTITFINNYAPQPPPPPPTCNACPSAPTIRDQNGRLWCAPCLADSNRTVAIAGANEWLTAAFMAVSDAQRARLYKMLSAAFHPDQGGDERLMIALNRVREMFPS